MLKALKRFTENPYVNIVIGLLLLYAGASEAWHELQELEEVTIGVHHGVILYAILHVLKSLPEIFEGLDHAGKG